MRTVRFKDVLWSAATKVGLIPELDGLGSVEAYQLVDAINSAYRVGWFYYPWPEAQRCEAFTPELRDGYRVVPLSSAGKVLSVIDGIYDKDPRVNADAREVVNVTQGDWIFFNEPPEAVWIVYTPPAPRFSSRAWDAGTVYVSGDVVYAADRGECYVALVEGPFSGVPVTDGTYWEVVPFMALLEEAVKAGAVAGFLNSEGQFATAERIRVVVEEALADEADKLILREHRRHTIRR